MCLRRRRAAYCNRFSVWSVICLISLYRRRLAFDKVPLSVYLLFFGGRHRCATIWDGDCYLATRALMLLSRLFAGSDASESGRLFALIQAAHKR